MIVPRKNRLSRISYLMVTEDPGFSYQEFIGAPAGFDLALSNLIRSIPTDLFQVLDPERYHHQKINQTTSTPVDFNVVYYENFNLMKAWLERPQIKILILKNLKSAQRDQILKSITKTGSHYYTFQDESSYHPTKKKHLRYYFKNAPELVKKIKRDYHQLVSAMEAALSSPDRERFKADVQSCYENSQQAKPLMPIPIFKAAHPTFFIFNQITANYWINGQQINAHSQDDLDSAQNEALHNPFNHQYKRPKIILDLVRKLDEETESVRIPFKTSDIETDLSPLICVFPFQNPQIVRLAKLYGIIIPEKAKRVFNVEQNPNYVFHIEGQDKVPLAEDHIASGASLIINTFTAERLSYLDTVAYLHATFRFSPVIRFPILGKSIYKELSFLKPNGGKRLLAGKLNRTIQTVGAKLNETLLYKELENYLEHRNGQIVAITDLPIECMQINGLPFQLTHDICRIPETNLRTAMASFAINNTFQYSIPANIMKKTLVILGAEESDKEFYESNQVSKKLLKERGIKYAQCKSVAETLAIIKEFKPALLVLDCHGNFDEETLSSHLIINGEKMTHEHIKALGVSIPIVFLSACMTNPAYGYVHSVANAFFEGGSLSVSTTMLPITISKGTTLYMRMLIHLEKVIRSGDFPNWLAFISYITRTAAFSEVVFKLCAKYPTAFNKDVMRNMPIFDQLEKIIDSTITFKKRRKTFETVNEHITGLDEEIKIDYARLVKENLLYSHLGRSDLILFEAWTTRRSEAFRKLARKINEQGI